MDDGASVTPPAIGWGVLFIALLTIIVVPFMTFGRAVDDWAFATLSAPRIGTLAIVGLVAGLLAVDVLLPIPSSLIATTSGLLLGVTVGTAASLAGLTAGCAIGYWLGVRAGRLGARKLLGSGQVERLEGLVARHGAWAIVTTRAVPVLAEGAVITAGAGAMPIGRFALASTAANLGLALVYAYVGARAAAVDSFLHAFAGSIALPAVAMAGVSVYHRLKRS